MQDSSAARVLITGGYGCIGAETTKWLLSNSTAHVIICSRRVSPARTERVFYDVDRSRLTLLEADVIQPQRLNQVLVEQGITHIVHLAALQTPDCNAHRDLGLQVNLAGTQNLIEAVKSNPATIERFVFASSIAVYGPREAYPPGRVPMLATPQPVNVYGVWKLAGEQICSFLWEDTGIATLCLRPGVLFGPGRDAGLTSSPTTAMKCVALGKAYEIPFRSRQDYLYAPDVGAAVARATLDTFNGYGTFTLPSHTLDTSQMVAAMRRAASQLGLDEQFQISIGQQDVPFICDLDFAPFLQAFPATPHTSLDAAVLRSMETFVDQVHRGWLTSDDIPS